VQFNPTTGACDPLAGANMVAARSSSTTPSDFADPFKGVIADEDFLHETKAVAIDTEVLQEVEKYSSITGAASVTPHATGGILSMSAWDTTSATQPSFRIPSLDEYQTHDSTGSSTADQSTVGATISATA